MLRFLLIIPLLSLLIIGCSVEEPGSPKWQVEVTIPIADRQYSMLELVADPLEADTSTNWISQNGDTLIFNFADSLDRITMEDRLTMEAFNFIIEDYVGVRTVNAPGVETAFYLLDDVAPELLPFVGQSIPVAPFDFSSGPEDLDAFAEFDWVFVDHGDVTVTVTNELPAPVEDLTIEIYGKNPHILVVHTDIPGPLNPGASESQIWPLPVGQEIDNEMEVWITGHSDGSTLPVLIQADDQLQVDLDISEMEITSAYAHIPEQNFDADTIFVLAENDTVSFAAIKNGYLTFTVQNNTELINTVVFTLPDFSLDNIPFSRTFTVNPNEQYTVSDINLTNYIFNRPQMDNQIQAKVDVSILDTMDPAYGNPNGFEVVDQDQQVTTDFYMSELVFTEFTGILDTIYMDLEQEAVEVEGLPEGLETLELEYANIDLHLTNSISLALNLNLGIEAYKDDAIAAVLDLPLLTVPQGDTANPALWDTTLTGLQSILNVLPDEILLTGDAFVMGDAAISDSQWLEVEFAIYTPLFLSIGNTYLQPEITKIEEGFDNWLHQVDLTLNLASHAPLSGNAYIIASVDSAGLAAGTAADADTFIFVELLSPEINSQGYVTNPVAFSNEAELDLLQLEKFSQASEDAPLFIKTLITINSTEGDTVRFTPSDYITVGAAAHAIVDVDFEEEEGGN